MVNNFRLDLCRELSRLLAQQSSLNLKQNATIRDVQRIQTKIDEIVKMLEAFDGASHAK